MNNGVSLSNNNGAAAITANGNYCAIQTGTPAIFNPQVIDYASVEYHTDGLVSAGSLVVQALGTDGTWRTINSATFAALAASQNVQARVNGPFRGVRINISALAGGNVTYAEVIGCVR
jgi:hypothetical protein